MTKLLVTSDLHFDDKKENEYRYEVVDHLLKAIDTHDPDALIIAGDLTDRKDKHSAGLVKKVVDLMVRLSDVVDVYVLRGNHDGIFPGTPFFGFLDEIENIEYIIHPESVLIEDSNVLFLPHSRQPDEEWKDINLSGYDYIFMHQTFSGAKAESGKKMEGMSFSRFRNLESVCVSGDIHVPQRIGPIIYCGAPHPVRFGDTFDPRLLLLDGHKKKSIKLDTMRKHSLTVSKPEDIQNNNKIREGDQIVVSLDLPESEFVDWEEYKKKTADVCESIGVRLSGVSLLKAPDKPSEEEEQDAPGALDREEAFDRYCGRWETPNNIYKIGKELLEDYL